ncbi:alpha/beta hydrolase [Streptomyces sp. NBC_01190]|uniref:alpha/beta hydrolase n=1 Tax=Streptomyces sp. NBC_01190 TaxID=2903767 RepID=UPI0038649819|nr:alpha/beta hydrolase [Streptomyces sp. NBC_01190]
MSLPALLLVHGAWHDSSAWPLLASYLPDVDVRTVRLPSTGEDPRLLGDLYADAAHIEAVLGTIGGPAVLLGHSYGGAPVSQTPAVPGLVRVIYLAAMMQEVGDAVLTPTGGVHPWYWDVHETDGDRPGHFGVRDPLEVLYNGVDPQLAKAAAGSLRSQSLASVTQPLTRALWHDVPSSYIVCEQDRAIPAEFQRSMAQHADRVRLIDSGHSPFLSHPEELARLIREEMTI